MTQTSPQFIHALLVLIVSIVLLVNKPGEVFEKSGSVVRRIIYFYGTTSWCVEFTSSRNHLLITAFDQT